MTTDESHENRDAEIEESYDDFLESWSHQGSSGTEDLRNSDKPWHICRDFIDPLAEELVEWFQKPTGTAEQIIEAIDDLTYFDVGADGIGSDASVDSWAKAQAWFDVYTQPGFRESFEGRIRTVSSKSRDLLHRLRNLDPSEDTEDWDVESRSSVEIMSFSTEVVEPVLEYLRNTSRFLKQKTAGRDSSEGSTAGNDISSGGAAVQARDERPKPRVEQEVKKYLRDKQADYDELVPARLNQHPESKKAFGSIFGPAAIAREINERCKTSEESKKCTRQAVSRTKTYLTEIQPLFKNPPQPPYGWEPPKGSDSAFGSEFTKVQREAGGG